MTDEPESESDSSSIPSDDDDDDDDFLREAAAIPKARQVPVPEPDRIGQELGHFRVLGKLGQGAMGIVYAAEDVRLRRKVALKILPASVVSDQERRLRFLREARSASAVSHPNIAMVFDVGETDGGVFIAMEHVEGRTLRELVGEGPLGVTEALGYAREIARGLGKAHEAGVVHRDLKPENVMISDDGRVRILDFGLAKLLGHAAARGESDGSGADESRGESELATHQGRILGTPSYMSPEQAKGRSVDARTDIFALGVVLYEMLAGTRPFRGDSASNVLAAIERDEPEPAALKNPGVSSAVQRVLDRCLAKDAEARYPDCAALVADLDRLLAAPHARPRDRWRFAAAVVAALAIGAVVTAVALGARREEAPRAPSDAASLPTVGQARADTARASPEPRGDLPIASTPTATPSAASPAREAGPVVKPAKRSDAARAPASSGSAPLASPIDPLARQK